MKINTKNNNNDHTFIQMPRYQMRKNALRKILSKLSTDKKSILEIGYGAGEIFSLYNKLGLIITGFDFSPEAYKYASRLYADIAQLITEENEINSNKYDFVCACEVLEHIKNDQQALSKWTSYLKDNGKLIISVPAHQSRWSASDVWAGHYRRYERDQLQSLLESSGLQLEKIYNYNFPINIITDILGNNAYKKDLKSNDLSRDKERASQRSGVQRNYSPLVKLLTSPVLWWPFIKLTELFYDTDYGTAYILIASKQKSR